METLNAAIIGGGAIHLCHVGALRQVPGVRLHALAEIDSEKGQALARTYGCHFYQDYRALLWDDEIDVVHICTPHHLHKAMVMEALAAGKHVFCEKPIGLDSREAAEIAGAAARAPGRLAVCYQNRLNPTSRQIMCELAGGTLGKMIGMKAVLTWSRGGRYYTHSPWRGRYATEGGSLLINQAIHTLDLMQWFGGGVARVKGVVDSGELAAVTEAEDSAMATLHFHNGARGLFYASNSYTTDAPLLLEIHCEAGMLQLRDNQLWRVCAGGRTHLISDPSPESDAKAYWGSGHLAAIRQFYQTLHHPSAPAEYTSIEEAGKSLALVEAIYHSSQTRQWITVNA
ncbi:gfo/Idh/MocA family oxidoreductase [Chimaeribacter californicus]|uniref:Gfo/Idh/MocA family oxidoreductase n=1 Tax=Chimaeribacter californicus TaxID=2060067 RepID=A0A2N5DY18_9GAMM|nr:Gfo/Idh/MocA family oxidoreductase [Chimaeribacter californicus]PLR32386.1 gfo/Idh/MocA family oxidoreductase [Chimaeribacter californicus]